LNQKDLELERLVEELNTLDPEAVELTEELLDPELALLST
jgi:hypothetical protein